MPRVPIGDITLQSSIIVDVPRVQNGEDFVRLAANGRALMSGLSDGSIADANRTAAVRTNTSVTYVLSTPPEKVEVDEHTGNTAPVVGTGGDDDESHTIEEVTGADPYTRGGEERTSLIEGTGGDDDDDDDGGSSSSSTKTINDYVVNRPKGSGPQEF